MSRTLRVAARAALALLLAALAACGRLPRPGATLDTVAVRYAVRCAHRAAMLRALTADLVVRVDGRATGRVPALSATLALASPDRVRLRVGALLGVAVDVLCARDSVFAWVPSEQMAFAAPAESLGLHAPAGFVARAVGATWEPPSEAWRTAVADSAGWHLGWREGGDSLALVVAADALPREVAVLRGAMGVRVRYEAWTDVHGEALPSRWRFADDSGWARVRVECVGARAEGHARDGWFEQRMPAAARTLGWEDLRAVLAGRDPR